MLSPNIGIIGIGSYLPEMVRTNEELENNLGLKFGWIEAKTGIRERRVAAKHEATSDLATCAAQRALRSANIQASDIDLIIIATSTPDVPMPSTACIVQANLGASKAAAFDISAVCCGFIYALTIVEAAMHNNNHFRTALVIGAETYSRILDYQDRRTCVLFGDGAGAVILGKVPQKYGVVSSYIRSDGTKASLVTIPSGGSRTPISVEEIEQKNNLFHMDGRGVKEFLKEALPDAIQMALQEGDCSLSDVNLIIPHQANGVLLKEYTDAMVIDEKKIHFTIEKYGNTGAASVPITLKDALNAGRLKDGDLILMMAFGGGMTWGSMLMRWINQD